MSASITSANPFSDRFAISASSAEPNLEDGANPATTTNEICTKMASRPDKVTIPILEQLSPVSAWSPLSSGSTLSMVSTAPTSPIPESYVTPIQWNNADLMYLLSCLLPDELVTNSLVLSPSLDALPAATYPLSLQLFKKASTAPSPQAYSKDAPIGTGRPKPRILIAASDNKCTTAADARKALAHSLLSNFRMLSEAVDRYKVLTTLHHLPTSTLHSVYRSLRLMASISDREWIERMRQLCGFVDGYYAGPGVDFTHPVEARLEIFFLEVGRGEVGGWVKHVNVALGLGERDRRVWGRVYAGAAVFLGRAIGEVFGI